MSAAIRRNQALTAHERCPEGRLPLHAQSRKLEIEIPPPELSEQPQRAERLAGALEGVVLSAVGRAVRLVGARDGAVRLQLGQARARLGRALVQRRAERRAARRSGHIEFEQLGEELVARALHLWGRGAPW